MKHNDDAPTPNLLFQGTFVNKIDKKGRVSVPPTVRHVIYNSELVQSLCFLPPFQDYICAEGYGRSRIDEISKAIDDINPLSMDYDVAMGLFAAQVVEISMDKEGRIILPREILDLAQLEDEVVFMGMGRKFQIWNPANHAIHLKRLRDMARNNPKLLPWNRQKGV